MVWHRILIGALTVALLVSGGRDAEAQATPPKPWRRNCDCRVIAAMNL